MNWLKLLWVNVWNTACQYFGMEHIILGLSLLSLFFVCFFVLNAVAKAVGSKNTGVVTTSLVLLLGLAAVFLFPSIVNQLIARSLPWGGDLRIRILVITVILFIVIVIPFASLVWKVNYLKSLFAIVIGIIAGVLTVILVQAAVCAYQTTSTDMKKIRATKKQDESFFR